MKRPRAIIIRLVTIVAAVAAAGGAYIASVNSEATAATYNVGGIDLLVDSKTYYNKVLQPKLSWSAKDLQPHADRFFDFPDIKPGDSGTTTISLHLKKSSAWMCLSFDDFKEKENGRNEPETKSDSSSNAGELGKGIEFFAWRDDGDNKFEVGEKPLFGTSTQSGIQVIKGKTYALADYKNGPAWMKDSKHYVGISWCAGDLTVNVANAKVTCDGSVLGNEAQTDSLAFSVGLFAVPSTQDPKFVCGGKPSGHDYGNSHGHSGYDPKGSWYALLGFFFGWWK